MSVQECNSGRKAARTGAAVFALGLVLAGPQAAGVASADNGDGSSTTSSSAADSNPGAQPRSVGRGAARSSTASKRDGVPTRSARASRATAEDGTASRSAAERAPRAAAPVSAPARPGSFAEGSNGAAASAVIGDVQAAGAAVSASGPEPLTAPRLVSVEGGSALPAAAVTPKIPARVQVALPNTPGAVTHANTASAKAPVLTALNNAVNKVFANWANLLSRFPAGPINELMSGALLLVRRGLFNQLPTAAPIHYLTTADGDLVGNVNVSDPESDTVTYRLLNGPQYGTVQLADNGTWTYTPDPDYSGSDDFVAAVVDRGFNLLDPLSNRVIEVTVRVGDPATQLGSGSCPSCKYTRAFDIVNLTTSTLIPSTDTVDDRGQHIRDYGRIVVAPWYGTVLQPGDTAHYVIGGDFLNGLPNVRAAFIDTADGSWAAEPKWTAVLKGVGATQIDSFSTLVPGYRSGDISSLVQGNANRASVAALVDSSSATVFTPADQGAEGILTWLLSNTTALSMTNVQFNPNPPGDPGYTRQVSADNNGDAPGSINKTVSASTSTTKGSSWEVNGKVAWSAIEKVLGLEVAGKYGKSESETNAKTYTTTVTSTSLPWSANEILTAPPKLLVTGDAQFVVGSGAGTRTYSFRGVQYYFPSQTVDAPLYLLKTEPLQPKYTAADNVAPSLIGTPVPNVGFTLRDKDSKFLSPTYAVGQRAQLTVSAYQGVGATADKTGDPRTIYSTSNSAVATVDKTGALTAVGPGTATITARYNWSIPYGGGTVRNDYVLATIDVTVT